MNQKHLAKFIEYKDEVLVEEQWIGYNIKNWWQWVKKYTEKEFPEGNQPDGKLTRNQLKRLCSKDSHYADWECLAAVMAWGGQNRKHGVTLFNRFDEIQPLIHDMRHGILSSQEAYSEFYKVWMKPEKLGMGAAYFTKLIFFCEPSHKGYIMDQWTSKSINLLSGEKIVHLISGHVSKNNTMETYKKFCALTDQIGDELGHKGEEIEIAMFSKGGRKKWKWRDYVVKEYKQLKIRA